MTGMGVEDTNQLRYELEQELINLKEIEFGKEQKNKWRDIVEIINLIMLNKNEGILPSGVEFSYYKEERPAYLEWVIWRAFLALNHLQTSASECRRFKIDQDLRPTGHASGGDADCIFTFEKEIIVSEVTLTESSRQEAAEGSPVRLHVSKYASINKNKDVYGLFIANKIDINASETFRNATRWDNDASKSYLNIVPLTLEQFRDIFIGICKSGNIEPKPLIGIIKVCLCDKEKYEGPARKNRINDVVNQFWGGN